MPTNSTNPQSVSPSRMTAADFPQELLDLYDYYAHGLMTRREFLDKAGKFAVGGVTASMLLQQLSPNYALAQQVNPDDPAISTKRITYPSPKWSWRSERIFGCTKKF